MKTAQSAATCWEPALETMNRDALEDLQLKSLRATVDQALKGSFYQKRLKDAGISTGSDIKSLADLSRIPFTTKNDLRDSFPYGMLCVDRDEVIRLHASSGTTGIPTVIYHSAADIARWQNLCARSIIATGCSKRDVFQNMMTYGLFTGGLGLHYGAEKAGLLVIPAGPGNTMRQFKLMQDFGSTVVHATPSYLLHMYEKMQSERIPRESIRLAKAFVGAEPHSENTRLKLQQLFGIDVYNSYGLSEMNGPGVAFECVHKAGMHLWEDCYIAEIIDPETGLAVPDGETGELVLTILGREAHPILRYRTRDLTCFLHGECACGRSHRRIARIKGRSDDMLIINGVNVFPSQIEEVLMKLEEVGTNYQIVLEKAGALDKMIIRTEVTPKVFSDDSRDLHALIERIKERLKACISINPAVELHESGVLPVTEGKAKRVFDNRGELT